MLLWCSLSFFAIREWMCPARLICTKWRVDSASCTRYAQKRYHRVDHLRAWKDYLQIEKDYLRIEKDYLRVEKTIYGSIRLFTAWGYFYRMVSLFLITWCTFKTRIYECCIQYMVESRKRGQYISLVFISYQGIQKGERGLFLTPVIMLWGRGHFDSHVTWRLNYWTSRFGGLEYEKIQRYNNSPPYVMARWPPQRVPPLKVPCFLPIGMLYWFVRLRFWVSSLLFNANFEAAFVCFLPRIIHLLWLTNDDSEEKSQY